MPGVERQGDPATCGHPNTGSKNVFADGFGVSRVQADSAGGTILGPGSATVFVNGFNVSLPGDSIAAHGLQPHLAPVTSKPSDTVFAW